MSKFNPEITDAGEIPADILAQLEATPDDPVAAARRKIPQIDAALRRYYPAKSCRAIARCFEVSEGTVSKRVKELGL